MSGRNTTRNPSSESHFSFAPSRFLAAGVQLDVFSPLSNGPRTAAAVAQEIRASERGTRMLLDALVVLGLLRRCDGAYELTSASARYLARSSRDYMGWAFELELT